MSRADNTSTAGSGEHGWSFIAFEKIFSGLEVFGNVLAGALAVVFTPVVRLFALLGKRVSSRFGLSLPPEPDPKGVARGQDEESQDNSNSEIKTDSNSKADGNGGDSGTPAGATPTGSGWLQRHSGLVVGGAFVWTTLTWALQTAMQRSTPPCSRWGSAPVPLSASPSLSPTCLDRFSGQRPSMG